MVMEIADRPVGGGGDLVGRLPLLEPDELDHDQRKLYEALDGEMVPWAKKSGFEATTGDGRLIGPFNPLLYSPQIGQGFVEYLSAERESTSLSARVREVIILSVGAVWQSAYEIYAHVADRGRQRRVAPVLGDPPAERLPRPGTQREGVERADEPARVVGAREPGALRPRHRALAQLLGGGALGVVEVERLVAGQSPAPVLRVRRWVLGHGRRR